MAQPALSSSDKLIANSPAQGKQIDVTWTGFLKYKAPFDEPTLELKYEIDYSLADVIDTFKSMVFDDIEKLPERFRENAKFTKRKCTFTQKSKSNTGEFKGNDNLNLCEVIKFDTTLEPLIPGFDAKEYEKKMKEKEEKDAEKNKEKATGWSSWTSASAWKDWGKSMVDMEAWGNSINSWMQYLNMNTDATEIWKIDWIQHKATSFVKNITFSWTIGVYEYAEIEQLMHIDNDKNKDKDKDEEKNSDNNNDDPKKVIFIKKLYVHPLVSLPGFLMDLLKDQYRKDSDLQISIIKDLCKNPLKISDDESLQQLDDV